MIVNPNPIQGGGAEPINVKITNKKGEVKEITLEELAKCQGKGLNFLVKSYNQIKVLLEKGVLVQEHHVKEALLSLDTDKIAKIEEQFKIAVQDPSGQSNNTIIKIANLFSKVNLPQSIKTGILDEIRGAQEELKMTAERTKIIASATKTLDNAEPEELIKSLILDIKSHKKKVGYDPSGMGRNFVEFIKSGNTANTDIKEQYNDFKNYIREQGSTLLKERGADDFFNQHKGYSKDNPLQEYRIVRAQVNQGLMISDIFREVEKTGDMNRAIQELNALGPSDKHLQKEELNEPIESLLEKYGIKEEDIQKETMLYGTKEKAMIKMNKRIDLYREAGLDPSEVSPSLAKRQEETGYDIPIIKAVEKTFKNFVTGKTDSSISRLADGKNEISDHEITVITYEDIDTKKKGIIVEEKFIGVGAFKTAILSSDYFTTKKPEDRNEYVSVKPLYEVPKPLSEKAKFESEVEYGTTAYKSVSEENVHEFDKVQFDKDTLVDTADYLEEIKMTQALQGDHVIKVHKVVNLSNGNQVMLQQVAGFEITNETNQTKEKVVDLDKMTNLYQSNSLNHNQYITMLEALKGGFKGVKRMHDEGYIHRDLKPANILITREGEGVLSDFGTVTKINNDPNKASFAGTLQFSAPEAIKTLPDETGDTNELWKDIDGKIDVWSCGIILQECLKGGLGTHPLFNSEEEVTPEVALSTLSKVLEPENKKNYESNYSEPNPFEKPLEHLIWSATQLDPAKRPSMEVFIEKFDAYINKEREKVV